MKEDISELLKLLISVVKTLKKELINYHLSNINFQFK